MATISESLRLRLELLATKSTLRLLTAAEPLLHTASELLLSTVAWSETYLWYLEISLEELESRLAKDEPADTPLEFPSVWYDEVDWSSVSEWVDDF
jgi:hypothetical protein